MVEGVHVASAVHICIYLTVCTLLMCSLCMWFAYLYTVYKSCSIDENSSQLLESNAEQEFGFA